MVTVVDPLVEDIDDVAWTTFKFPGPTDIVDEFDPCEVRSNEWVLVVLAC